MLYLLDAYLQVRRPQLGAMPTVNIIYVDNGFGLSRDFRLLAEAVNANGCDVVATALTDRHERWRRKARARWLIRSQRWWRRMTSQRIPKRFDLNVMLEHLWPQYFDQARYNVALPNPEWFDRHDMRFLRELDMIWAKTQNGVRIYQQLNCVTYCIGFASEDRFDAGVTRQRQFLHLAGASRIKGTTNTVNVWAQHQAWPMLNVVQDPREAKATPAAANITHCIEYLDGAKPAEYARLRHMQNSHKFHICLSETDAWGHYLVEALGVGAITLTTDAPPMNELVRPDRGLLVPYARTGQMALAATYHFDEQALVRSVEQAISLSDAELEKMSTHARAWFLENNRTFPSRVGRAIQAVA